MKPRNSVLNTMWNLLHPKPPTATLSTPMTQAQARGAIVAAQGDLDRARDNKAAIHIKVSALKEQRNRNHFAELIEATMRGNG